ncbi:hypothetical protein BD769DRAFT_766518 [Suillus cothurnatus]|nr:hypothetical protein BD769DRAFT_766518 [Suillus cothurnatus]
MYSVQKYLAATQPLIGADAAELGASVAETLAKVLGPVHRQLPSPYSISNWKSDCARALVSQFANKCYFYGEVAGLRLAARKSKFAHLIDGRAPQGLQDQDSLDKAAPQMQSSLSKSRWPIR